jgi:hypothetical protein
MTDHSAADHYLLIGILLFDFLFLYLYVEASLKEARRIEREKAAKKRRIL